MDYSVIINNIVLAIIAVASAYTAWQASKTKDIAAKTYELSKLTEINTNSMKDALVAATKVSAHLEGRAELRKENEAEAAIIAKSEKGKPVIGIIEGTIQGTK